jgi:hypothetical protein
MTIRRDQDVILLEDICAVEDAEILLQELLTGAAHVDWSGCTHLHTACLQVLLAARPPLQGSPANPEIARWVAAIVVPPASPTPPALAAASDTACSMEA